jgi:anti-sigma factor RsiW
MSACDDCRFLVPAFLDDELTGNELEDFGKHIASCDDCRQLLADEQCLSALLRRVRPLFQAPESLRATVSHSVISAARSSTTAPERLRQRVSRTLTLPPGSILRPAFRWQQLAAAAVIAALAFLSIPPVVQNVRANAFVEAAAATHRSYLQGNLPMEIHSSSPAAVTAWFAGKVPFQFQLPESQQPAGGEQSYRLNGSRLVNFKGSYAALTTYEMHGQTISLLVVSTDSARAWGGEEVQSGNLLFHDHTVDGFKVITWSNHGLTYALVSSLPGSARQSCLVCHQDMADSRRFAHRP